MTTNMSFRLLNVIIGLVSAILLSPRAALAETPLDISTPKNVKVSALLQPDGAKPSTASIAAAFDIDPDGLPAIADGTALKLIGTSQEMLSLGVLPIDDFAWMRDGKYPDMPFNHQMTFPCDMTLRTLNGSLRVSLRVFEIKSMWGRN